MYTYTVDHIYIIFFYGSDKTGYLSYRALHHFTFIYSSKVQLIFLGVEQKKWKIRFKLKMDRGRERLKRQREKNLRREDGEGAEESDGGLSVC